MSTATQSDIESFRSETRAWLEKNCPASMRTPVKGFDDYFWGGRRPKFKDEDQKQWFENMKSKGWTVPRWPKEYGGGGLSKVEYKVLKEEMESLGCRTPLFSFGIHMLGPALLNFGTEEQKKEHLTQIANGEIWWCQGYSEPGAGSDLAGLQTSAEDKGDHYLVNGQKVWTSYADYSDKIFCLVRTDKNAPKHTGISFLLIDMESAGVTTRPIKLISGSSPFCETFFDNVKVPKENLVGIENEGWSIAKYLLTHERSMIGNVSKMDKTLDQYAVEAIGRVEGKLADPVNRVEVARWLIDEAAFNLTLIRALDEAKAGSPPGAKSSFYKYYGTELNKRRYELMMSTGGFDNLIWGESAAGGKTPREFCRSKANSIEGGTSEIQLNIIAKHILGLPKS